MTESVSARTRRRRSTLHRQLLLLLLLMMMIKLLLMGILILLWRLSLRARPGGGCTPELRLGRLGGAAGGLRMELLLTLRWRLNRLLLM